MRPRNNIFQFIIPFQKEDFRTKRIGRPGTLIYKKSRIPVETVHLAKQILNRMIDFHRYPTN
ncbi:hypothetical protein DF044_21485 [Burkholderia contaminans]|nr:hypothetical protein DF044_21485 [Burkholderia contaminans]